MTCPDSNTKVPLPCVSSDCVSQIIKERDDEQKAENTFIWWSQRKDTRLSWIIDSIQVWQENEHLVSSTSLFYELCTARAVVLHRKHANKKTYRNYMNKHHVIRVGTQGQLHDVQYGYSVLDLQSSLIKDSHGRRTDCQEFLHTLWGHHHHHSREAEKRHLWLMTS